MTTYSARQIGKAVIQIKDCPGVASDSWTGVTSAPFRMWSGNDGESWTLNASAAWWVAHEAVAGRTRTHLDYAGD